MGVMVSYITWLHVTELFAQQFVEAYIEDNNNVAYYWSFVYRWILPTKGQLCSSCCHVMTS